MTTLEIILIVLLFIFVFDLEARTRKLNNRINEELESKSEEGDF